MPLRHDPNTGEPWLSEATSNLMNPPVYRWWEVEELWEASVKQGVELPPEVVSELKELKAAYETWQSRNQKEKKPPPEAKPSRPLVVQVLIGLLITAALAVLINFVLGLIFNNLDR